MVRLAVIGLGGWSVFLNTDHFHTPGETIHALSFYEEPGGKGYNQAVAAARLGAQVSFLYAVGQDENAQRCETYLREQRIRSLTAVREYPTAYAVILTDRNGDNRVTVYPGAQLTAEDVDAFADEISQADALLLQQEVPETVNRRAIALAQRCGIRVFLNPAPPAAYTNDLAGQVFLLTPNEQEATRLDTGRFDPLVVTRGSAGADLYQSGCCTRIPAPQVIPVDTTGAGDVFCATLALRICAGDTLPAAVATACRTAAVSTTHPHVMQAIARLEAVDP